MYNIKQLKVKKHFFLQTKKVRNNETQRYKKLEIFQIKTYLQTKVFNKHQTLKIDSTLSQYC